MPAPLEEFEGAEVVGSRIIVTRTGDGLSESLDVDPAAYAMGEVAFVLMRVRTEKIRFEDAPKPKKDDDWRDAPPEGAQVRVHIMPAESVALIDAADAVPLLVKVEERVAKAVEERRVAVAARREAARLAAEEAEGQTKGHAPLFGKDGQPLGDDEDGDGSFDPTGLPIPAGAGA